MKYRSNRAFLLPEVLITLAIISIGITLLLRSYSTCFSAIKLSQDMTLASILAQNQFWEIKRRFQDNLPLADNSTQEITLQNTKFNFSYELLDSETAGLKKINLKISWQESKTKERNLEFLSYLYRQ